MFQTSTPVVGAGFFNRKSELDQLAQAIAKLSSGAPRWIAILGPRKIGKTSLVLEAARRADSMSVRVVTLDVQEQDPASPQIFRRLILRVLDAALGAELGESLERLMRSPAAYRRALQRSEVFAKLPAGLRSELLELTDAAASIDRLHEWLELPEQLAQQLGLRFVIAIDEFQELEALARKQRGLFGQMRSIWQRHRHVGYFISGSVRSMLLTLISRDSSPFFHHFAIVDLGAFERNAAIELLRRAGDTESVISHDIAEKAVGIIGGHPFYLQLLGETLMQDLRAPTEVDLKDALQSLLFSPYGRLALFFENEMQRLVGRSTFLAATLDALASGPMTLTEVASRIRTSTGATVGYLERLKDAVTRTADQRYALADPTFSLWLRWKRPGEGTLVPTSVIGDAAEQAVAQLLAAMGFDLVYQSRASRGAFDLLATRGGMQLGIQVKRSPLPLRFTKSEWARLQAEASRLHWQWVLAAEGADGSICVLDPAQATKGREVRVGRDAVIENLLLWLDRGRTVGN
jgi:AAA+ ATPase superfamily predicted ATPase